MAPLSTDDVFVSMVGWLADGLEAGEVTGDECRSGRHSCTADQTCIQTRDGFLCQRREPDGLPAAVPGTSSSSSSPSSISSSSSSSPAPTTLLSARCRPGYAWNRITRQCEGRSHYLYRTQINTGYDALNKLRYNHTIFHIKLRTP